MKFLTLFILVLPFLSCQKEGTPTTTYTEYNIEKDTVNKVLILKLRYLDYSFVGGYELEFPDTNSFTLNTNYYSPGDFGSVNVYYQEFNELLFDGTIIWMGTGQQTFPQTIIDSNNFESIPINYPLPDTNSFVKLLDDTYNIDVGFHSQLWDAINNLKIVHQYRYNSPNSNINLLKYTPSVGSGNPEDWYWYVFLKN